MGLCLFFLLGFFNTVHAEGEVSEFRYLGYAGTEYIVRGDLDLSKKINDTTPMANFIGKTTGFAKYRNGKLIFDVNYTVDKNGFRLGPNAHKKNKTKHFLIIDASIAFGEGLNDNETIHDVINAQSKDYEAYAVGMPGYGLQHHWLKFKSKELQKHIPQKKGSAIIITSDADIGKATGNLNVLPFCSDFPRLVEVRDRVFEHVGTFAQDGTFSQRTFSRFCVPFRFCSGLLSKLDQTVSREEIIFGAKLINSIVAMYKEQFDVENVKVLWRGSPEGGLLFGSYSTAQVIYKDFQTSYEDGHPDKRAAEEVAGFLIRNNNLL